MDTQIIFMKKVKNAKNTHKTKEKFFIRVLTMIFVSSKPKKI